MSTSTKTRGTATHRPVQADPQAARRTPTHRAGTRRNDTNPGTR